MPLTDVERQVLVLAGVGDVDPVTGDPVQPLAQGSTGVAASNIGALWALRADKALLSTELRDLYVRRDALDMVIAVLRQKVDLGVDQGALDLKLSQRAKAAEHQRDDIQAELLRVETRVMQNRPPLLGQITQDAPIEPPAPGAFPQKSLVRPDASSPVYSGSPYWRGRRVSP